MRSLAFILVILFIMAAAFGAKAGTLAHGDLYAAGSKVGGIRDFREVLRGVLFRGGSTQRAPLNSTQLDAVCSRGIGTAYYLYSTGFTGSSTQSCSSGSTYYTRGEWTGQSQWLILRKIYDVIKTGGRPVFVHCWYGVHATGGIAAKALMQFCGMSNKDAVEYWKVGIAPRIQYPKVISDLMAFQIDPSLTLTPAERARVCPN